MFRNCEGITRRNCLQLGLGGLVGAGLAPLLRGQALAGAGVQQQKQADACILVWLDGGPTHYETFDPKPEAPVEIRGQFGTTPTSVPGVHFSEHMVKLAKVFEKYSLIRSIRHDQGNHGAGNHYMMTGAPPRIPVGCGAFVSFHPSLGSVVAKEVGAPDGLPPYFSMPSMSRSGGPNFLGANYAPFVVANDPNRSGFRVRDVALPDGVLNERFDRRRQLRSQLDQLPRWEDSAVGDPSVTADEFYAQGYQLMESRQAQAAFQVETESDSIRERYGRNSFGQRALLARRLVEAGVPFVTLYEGGWDHHTDIFNSISKRIPPLESTLAALIEDLEERGRLDRTLVLVLGEFGRTPKVNDRGGRDHWSNAMSVMMAGGGTPGGQPWREFCHPSDLFPRFTPSSELIRARFLLRPKVAPSTW
jgi:hypothetical protein